MSLKATIRDAVDAAFSFMMDGADGDSLLKTWEYTSRGEKTYNPTTGSHTGADVTKDINVFPYDFDSSEVLKEDIVLSTDMQVMFQQKDFIAGKKPKARVDTIEDDTGVKYNIIGVKADPADAIWILHIRRAS